MASLSGLFKKWEAPTFTQPMPLAPANLEELGIDNRGRHWFSHKKWGELIETAVIDEARQPLPDGLIVAIGDGMFRTFAPPVEPGTFRRLQAGWTSRAPRAPKPIQPVDGLAHLTLAAPRAERIIASPGHVNVTPAEGPARGPEQILARLTHAGADVRLSTDGASLIVSTSGGNLGPGILELVDRATPLLVAHLSGEPLLCVVGKHRTAVPAVSLALGGAPICEPCLGGAS